jgi:hypothetical protein
MTEDSVHCYSFAVELTSGVQSAKTYQKNPKNCKSNNVQNRPILAG